MKSNDNKWWDIFTSEKSSEADDNCPAIPISSGKAWQKGLVNLYCPCKSDATSYECQLVLM